MRENLFQEKQRRNFQSGIYCLIPKQDTAVSCFCFGHILYRSRTSDHKGKDVQTERAAAKSSGSFLHRDKEAVHILITIFYGGDVYEQPTG